MHAVLDVMLACGMHAMLDGPVSVYTCCCTACTAAVSRLNIRRLLVQYIWNLKLGMLALCCWGTPCQLANKDYVE